MNAVKLCTLMAICACLVGSALAVPVEIYAVPVEETSADSAAGPISLLDIENADGSAVDADSDAQRSTRGLGLLLGSKIGALGLGMKGFGGLGLGGLGGLHGFGGGLGGLGLKPFFGKPFLG